MSTDPDPDVVFEDNDLELDMEKSEEPINDFFLSIEGAAFRRIFLYSCARWMSSPDKFISPPASLLIDPYGAFHPYHSFGLASHANIREHIQAAKFLCFQQGLDPMHIFSLTEALLSDIVYSVWQRLSNVILFTPLQSMEYTFQQMLDILLSPEILFILRKSRATYPFSQIPVSSSRIAAFILRWQDRTRNLVRTIVGAINSRSTLSSTQPGTERSAMKLDYSRALETLLSVVYAWTIYIFTYASFDASEKVELFTFIQKLVSVYVSMEKSFGSGVLPKPTFVIDKYPVIKTFFQKTATIVSTDNHDFSLPLFGVVHPVENDSSDTSTVTIDDIHKILCYLKFCSMSETLAQLNIPYDIRRLIFDMNLVV